MNILPKKSWHVRNRDNIERVRRDEAQAADEEKERQRKIALAESEARTDGLRQKARALRGGDSDVGDRVPGQEPADKKAVVESLGHINFFAEEEQGLKSGGTNAEYEAEKRQEQEKKEKDIGLLTYLGQSSAESQTTKPWYYKPPEKRMKLEEISAKTKSIDEFDKKSKYSLDPMRQMVSYLDTKRKVEQRDAGRSDPKMAPVIASRRSEGTRAPSSLESIRGLQLSQPAPVAPATQPKHSSKKDKSKKKKHKKEKKHKKHKSKKRRKQRSRSPSSSSESGSSDADSRVKSTSVGNHTASASSQGPSLQQLRAERLRRERTERRRTEELMAKLRGDNSGQKQQQEVVTDDRERGYNSQFNPELVRKRKAPRESYDM